MIIELVTTFWWWQKMKAVSDDFFKGLTIEKTRHSSNGDQKVTTSIQQRLNQYIQL
jgi:hypothetical protein